MGIRQYIKEAWNELWNPDSRPWRYIGRILFPLLPIISLLGILIPQKWVGIMTILIPLSIWFAFIFFVVPYKLVCKYHSRYDEAKSKNEELIREKTATRLVMAYRDQEWGFNAAVPNPARMVTIDIDYNPTQLMQVAKVFLKIPEAPRIKAWGFSAMDISKRECKPARFYLPDEEPGTRRAKLVVLANNEEVESPEFDLNIPGAG